jgi:hypothetical protein
LATLIPRHCAGPAGVERQMSDDFLQFCVGDVVLTRPCEVTVELLGAAVGDECRHGDQTAVAFGELGALPDVSEQGSRP